MDMLERKPLFGISLVLEQKMGPGLWEQVKEEPSFL
jgi:hypothetical protein